MALLTMREALGEARGQADVERERRGEVDGGCPLDGHAQRGEAEVNGAAGQLLGGR